MAEPESETAPEGSRWATVRHALRPGDFGRVVEQHGALYAAEYGFDLTFEAYVAESLAELGTAPASSGRLWLAELDGRLAGSIGIVERLSDRRLSNEVSSERAAQLRWFLVAPEARGQGLGQRLLNEALAFCRERAYARVYLWTVSLLTAAARRYRAAGFTKTEEQTHPLWGLTLIEERYDLRFPRD